MSCVTRAVSFLVVPVVLLDAFRVRPQKRKTNQTVNASLFGADGVVDALYTWGAASPSKGYLEDAKSSDGCWEGLRIVNVNTDRWSGIWEVDIVPPLLSLAGYEHAKQQVAKIDNHDRIWNYDCGKKFNSLEWGIVPIHMQDRYLSRAGQLPQPAQDLTKFALMSTYMTDHTEVANYIKPYGWNYVGTSEEKEKVVHLLQDPSSLECIITFQGTSNNDDWWDNLAIADAEFCGLPRKVHSGFRSQLRWTLEASQFQSNIRPKLGKCAKVTAVGHSLGGALASLFAACTNNAPTSGDGWKYDYKFIQWTKESPQKLPPIA